jgi:hypothetical protein
MTVKLLPVTLAIVVSGYANAGRYSPRVAHEYDSVLPMRNNVTLHAGILVDLLTAEIDFRQAGNAQRTILKLLRIAGTKNLLHNNTLGTRIFTDLANISTRLKLYPLAMKCYDQANRLNQKRRSSYGNSPGISDTAGYSRILQTDTLEIMRQSSASPHESLPVGIRDIKCSFEDGKTAVSYAIIIHVKQPIRGHRKAFSGIRNVGHTFITLIKLNDDNTSVSRSVGFYPAKKYFLSATPLHPGDGSVFKDDAMHSWDEMAGKFITEKKFKRILDNIRKYSRMYYNLNKNNCTDFGLSEAIIAGIDINKTAGCWPMGSGNNPANTGQSLLERNFQNNDNEYPETFVVNEGEDLFGAN